jgi:hypothetical protein
MSAVDPEEAKASAPARYYKGLGLVAASRRSTTCPKRFELYRWVWRKEARKSTNSQKARSPVHKACWMADKKADEIRSPMCRQSR